MNILAPDEANFNHLLQINRNIEDLLKNQKKILSNGIEMLIIDSLDRAIEIHSQLPALSFPISKWLQYLHIDNDKLLKILNNTPVEQFPSFIDNLVSIEPFKSGQNFNPFVLSLILGKKAQSIIESKGSYSDFQKLLLEKFIEKIPHYKGAVNSYAFAEIVKMESFILPENNDLFKSLNSTKIDSFLSNAFKNDLAFSLFYESQSFFKFFNVPIFEYLKSSRRNSLIEAFVEKCTFTSNNENTYFPTLFSEEIRNISSLKIKHDFLSLEEKIPHKNIKVKASKI